MTFRPSPRAVVHQPSRTPQGKARPELHKSHLMADPTATVSAVGVGSPRRRRAPKYPLGGIPWDAVDWSKRTTAIAAELGVAPGTVSKAREIYARETLQRRTHAWWDAVDWSVGTFELARRFGVHPSTISHCRARYAPDTLKGRVR